MGEAFGEDRAKQGEAFGEAKAKMRLAFSTGHKKAAEQNDLHFALPL